LTAYCDVLEKHEGFVRSVKYIGELRVTIVTA
jgi:hypothetical protein